MFENREGQKVSNVVFHTRQNNAWVDVSTDDVFKGKTVIVFSLPGAFTRRVRRAMYRVLMSLRRCFSRTVWTALCACRSTIPS